MKETSKNGNTEQKYLITNDSTYSRFIKFAESQLLQGNSNGALRTFKECLSFKPNGVEAIYGCGVCFLVKGTDSINFNDSALFYLLRVYEINKQFRSALYNISVIYYKKNELDSALRYIDESISTHLDDPIAYLHKAYILIKLKNETGACDNLNKAIDLGLNEVQINQFPLVCKKN